MKYFIILFIFLFTITSCSIDFAETEDNHKKKEIISLVTWNVQTFFDSEIEGTEYSDYQNLAKWSKDKYLTRLGRLCEVMKTLNADVYVLEEIENTAVMQDIANQLAGVSWDRAKMWNYGCFAKDAGSAIGCAVFSRFELKDMKVHSICVKTQSDEQPGVRPLIQVTVDTGGGDFLLFVNHWKSKSGGETGSEIWRDWQESVVADTMRRIEMSYSEKKMSCVLCGDFNRDILEFSGDAPNVSFRGQGFALDVLSPWFNSSGSFSCDTGSYYYDGEWERIDHIFGSGDLKISAFSPQTQGVWCGAGGVPNSYKLYSGDGYSDHVPLMCAVSLF